MLEYLRDIDTSLLLFVNSQHNFIFDFIMYWASNRYIWIPLYAYLFYVLANKTESKNQLLIFILFVLFLIVITDQLSVLLFKETFQRRRPCWNVAIMDQLHLVTGCGGEFGFISSHAANTGALFVFVLMLFNESVSWIKWVLLPWILLICYSRIYLGVHYPLDVLCGLMFGGIVGYIFSRLYFIASKKFA